MKKSFTIGFAALFFTLLINYSFAQNNVKFTYVEPALLSNVNKQLIETTIKKNSSGKIQKIHIGEDGYISFLQNNDQVTREDLAKILGISLPNDPYQLSIFKDVEENNGLYFITLELEVDDAIYLDKIGLTLQADAQKLIIQHQISDGKLILVAVQGVTPYHVKEVIKAMRTEIKETSLL
ncbi:MAG: hypothetical protein ACXITV_04515 [Luteibaculaceae bacterium]